MTGKAVRMFLALGFLAGLPALSAQADPVRPADRQVINACTAKTKKPETCIGKVYDPCVERPDGQSTMGMGICAGREIAVWDERLNAAYQKLMNGNLGDTDAMPENRPPENARKEQVKGSELIRDMQRTWILFRAKKCDVSAMREEGGSMSRITYGYCTLRETAIQAIWLTELVDDTEGR